MELGFNKVANDDRTATASTASLRGQALKRLGGAQQRLESKGINPRTARRADAMGDMGLLGTLIVGMVAGGPFMSMLHAHFPATDAFNFASFSPCMDGVSYLRDQMVEGHRARRVDNFYPEGRRRDAEKAAKVGRKFNLVSANQNNRLSFDTQAEIACMCEILDMLDMLERQGVTELQMQKGAIVYDELARATSPRKMDKIAVGM